eukprot:scaffold196823_cov15-Tisochrysis_lutea.AAC.1
MLTLLDSALEANGVLSIQQEPQRYLAVLLQCCSREQKALEFLSKYKVTNPNSSVPEIKQAFLDRFQAEVRTRAAKARDALFNMQTRMVGNMSVQDYANLFRQQI